MEINDDKLFENKFDTTEVCFFAKFGRVQLSLIINNNPKLALIFESILFFANSYLIEWNSKKWSKTFWTISLSLADKTKNKMLRFVAQKNWKRQRQKWHTQNIEPIRFPHSWRVPFLGPDPFQFVLKSVNQFFSPILHQFISFSLSFVTTPTRRRQTGGKNWRRWRTTDNSKYIHISFCSSFYSRALCII